MPSPKPTDTPASKPRKSSSAKPDAPPRPNASAPNAPPPLAALSKLQAYTYKEIHRSRITNAPYNPRVISDYQRKRLRQQLEKHGLVEALVWNERTGHLVGGHQRLGIVDAIEGTQDYTIGVCAIDVDLRREKAINVALNNPHIQGAYDQKLFFDLLKSEDAPDLDDMGFTTADLEMEFGALPEVHEAFEEAQQRVEPLAQDLKELKQRRAESKARMAEAPENEADYYLMIVFRSNKDKESFLQHLERPLDMRFMQADELETYLQERYVWRKTE